MQFDWSAIWPAIPILLEGAKMTLWISVLGLAGGLIKAISMWVLTLTCGRLSPKS